MEIKKFEAYKYKGPALLKLKRKDILDAINDRLADGEIFGYNINGTTFFLKDEILWIQITKQDDIGNWDDKIIKIDLSDVGIEIGSAEWDDEEEEYKEFIPEINLDTDITKQLKTFKKDIKKYNVI